MRSKRNVLSYQQRIEIQQKLKEGISAAQIAAVYRIT